MYKQLNVVVAVVATPLRLGLLGLGGQAAVTVGDTEDIATTPAW